MSSHQEAWLIAALDAIQQFRATKAPLKNIVRQLQNQRRLGPRERAKMSDAVFAWARADHQSPKPGRQSQREVDEAIVRQALSEGASSEVAFPAWFTERLQKVYGERAPALLLSLKERAGPTLAFDTRKLSLQALKKALDDAGVAYQETTLAPSALRIQSPRFRLTLLPEALQPHLWLMDEASQYAAGLVEPAPDEWVLDYCAGAGIKTHYLVTRGAKVVAMDISEKRLANAKLLNAKEAVRFVVADGRDAPFKKERFSRILLDAPCSGTGTLRRAPDLLLRLGEAEIARFVTLQRELLAAAFALLKPQGVLIYATCSILPEENAEQIAWARAHLDATLLSEKQLLPSEDQSDGFFVAALQKKGE